MILFAYVLLLLAIFAATATASPVALQVRALADGGFVLSQTTPTSEISYTAFCLDKDRAMPAVANFDLLTANNAPQMDAVLLQRAAWIARQEGAMADKQAAIWSVMGARVSLSVVAQQFVLDSQGQRFDLSMQQVLISTDAAHQRYLVAGVASSAAAETPEPASLLLLATGAGTLLMRRRKLL